MSGLYEKLGIRSVSITSGKNKDMSKLTEEQIADGLQMIDGVLAEMACQTL